MGGVWNRNPKRPHPKRLPAEGVEPKIARASPNDNAFWPTSNLSADASERPVFGPPSIWSSLGEPSKCLEIRDQVSQLLIINHFAADGFRTMMSNQNFSQRSSPPVVQKPAARIQSSQLGRVKLLGTFPRRSETDVEGLPRREMRFPVASRAFTRIQLVPRDDIKLR